MGIFKPWQSHSLSLLGFALCVACSGKPDNVDAKAQGVARSASGYERGGWLVSMLNEYPPEGASDADATPAPKPELTLKQDPSQERGQVLGQNPGQGPDPDQHPGQDPGQGPGQDPSPTAMPTAVPTPPSCIPPAPPEATVPLVVWPYSPEEDSAAAAGAYVDLGDSQLFSEDGEMVWNWTSLCPISAVRIALPEHSVPYATPEDYEGAVTNTSSTGNIALQFHTAGVYSLKIEFVDPNVSPAVATIFANAGQRFDPKSDCDATRSRWIKELSLPRARHGMLIRKPGDRVDDYLAANLDVLREALNVRTVESAATSWEAENKLEAYAFTQQNSLPFSLTLSAHGLPSKFDSYEDDMGQATSFGVKFKGKIWQVNMAACCTAMGYPHPQWAEGRRHLLSTFADMLSDFPNAAQASSAGAETLVDFIYRSFRRGAYHAVPVSASGVLKEVKGKPWRLSQYMRLDNPHSGNQDLYSYTAQNTTNPLPANCVNLNSDDPEHVPMDWHDNVLCGPAEATLGLQFSKNGTLPGKRCTKVEELSDPAWGTNSHICVNDLPQNPIITFYIRKPASTQNCLQILEPSEPWEHTWLDNWMCFSFPPAQENHF